ncbi:MAG: glutamate-5-semialdehyde dehydrogenase [Cytophagales bacterium]
MSNINLFKSVKKAARIFNFLDEAKINTVLNAIADKALSETTHIIEQNAKDLVKMDISDPKYDRLLLTKERIENIADEIRKVASLQYPVGRSLEKKIMPNGLELEKITVPLGVVGIIYEARPNVTFDCFALCFKSGNAVLLKGGSDAENSNIAIVSLIHSVLNDFHIDKNCIGLLPADREATLEMLNASGFVDVLIPRGSQSLIDYVRQNAKIPVIETGAGIVHVYFDEYGDIDKGKAIINNSKTRRVSVCNALDCLLIHKSRLEDLKILVQLLVESEVVIYADQYSYSSLSGYYPSHLLQKATPDSFGTEFLDYKMAIKTVDSLEETLEYIAEFSSQHSEAIISENEKNINVFLKSVDAAAVYANASTAFTDGAQFGLGAEIGISTQKLHARGPMALNELTSYKWLVKGTGQIRK